MIRDRDHEEYERVLKFKILNTLPSEGLWIDMCCGEGKALTGFAESNPSSCARLVGIDTAAPRSTDRVCFVRCSAMDYYSPTGVDLITCTYGLLHLEEKMEALQHWYNQLNPNGLLIANIDTSTLFLEGDKDAGLAKMPGAKFFVSDSVCLGIRIRKTPSIDRIIDAFEFVEADYSDYMDFPCIFTTYRVR